VVTEDTENPRSKRGKVIRLQLIKCGLGSEKDADSANIASDALHHAGDVEVNEKANVTTS
jgi:hypothetical protein